MPLITEELSSSLTSSPQTAAQRPASCPRPWPVRDTLKASGPGPVKTELDAGGLAEVVTA